MRGKLRCRISPQSCIRIIPAHAGQTITHCIVIHADTDHPRACGANKSYRRNTGRYDGSSPRMRGKLPYVLCVSPKNRIIPAHAGQTEWCRHSPQSRTDHPRACGANTCSASEPGIMAGSSPRMRGKRRLPGYSGSLDRIIPAHAGQTASLSSLAISP